MNRELCGRWHVACHCGVCLALTTSRHQYCVIRLRVVIYRLHQQFYCASAWEPLFLSYYVVFITYKLQHCQSLFTGMLYPPSCFGLSVSLTLSASIGHTEPLLVFASSPIVTYFIAHNMFSHEPPRAPAINSINSLHQPRRRLVTQLVHLLCRTRLRTPLAFVSLPPTK